MPSFARATPSFTGLTVALVFGLFAGCSDTTIDVIPEPPIGPVDSTLLDGFVDTDRPPNPPLSFDTPCPLRTIPEGVHNPNVTLGCLRPDCIMAIDTPDFEPVSNTVLVGQERIVAVEMDGQVRGFPIRIMMYHEVVNLCWNLSDGSQVYSAITYCPIVDVATHFIQPDLVCDKPKANSYGVSGAIYNGNLIVYRRGTDSLVADSHVQMYGGGWGPKCLEFERVNIDMPWSLFAELYPNAEVLTTNTGLPPPPEGYDLFDHPYREFWLSKDLCVNGLCFPISSTDSRLALKELVYGLYTPTETKAYPLTAIGGMVINDQVGGVNVALFHDRGAIVAFEALVEFDSEPLTLTFSFLDRERHGLPLFEDEQTGSLWTFDGIAVRGPLKGERLPQMLGYRAFWFAWAAFFPETSLHKP